MKSKLDRYLLGLISFFIVLSSVEILFKAGQEVGLDLDHYRSILIITYFRQIFIPIVFSLYYLFLFKRIGTSSLAELAWYVLLLLTLANQVLSLELTSFFYYTKLLSLIMMLAINHSYQRSSHAQ